MHRQMNIPARQCEERWRRIIYGYPLWRGYLRRRIRISVHEFSTDGYAIGKIPVEAGKDADAISIAVSFVRLDFRLSGIFRVFDSDLRIENLSAEIHRDGVEGAMHFDSAGKSE